MFEFTPFVQDVIASMLAAGAFGVLVYRTVGILRPSASEPPCTTCGACAPAATPEGQEAATLIPLNQLRRSHGSSEQPGGGIRLIG